MTTGTVPVGDEDLVVDLRDIRKSFDGVEVLRGVDLGLRRGEVHALLGGNGAGKSTLMKTLLGVHRSDSGRILIDGAEVEFATPNDSRDAGLAMVFQEFSLIPSLSVGRNILFGREPRRFGIIDDRELNRQAAEVLERMGVDLDPRAPLASLSVGYWQLTEIAKAVSKNAMVLILDEPTATLPYHEAELLFRIIDRLKRQGVSIIYISHRMAEIARVADRLSVLRDGVCVLTANTADVSPEAVIEAIVGRQIHEGISTAGRVIDRAGEPLLTVDHLRAGDKVKDVSFELRAGEILGLAGLIGSGRSELARCLFGVDRVQGGEVRLRGRSIAPRGAGAAIDAGIMLVPEDRQQQGLVQSHSVRANLLLPSLGRLRSGPLIDDRRASRLTAELIERLGVKTASPDTIVRRLSGGNQQKIVIAKWLGLKDCGHAVNVLILDEPTNGVDIATKTEIMRLVVELAEAGTGVILISSELEELLAVADRVLILRAGEVVDDLDRSQIADEQSLQLAIQGV